MPCKKDVIFLVQAKHNIHNDDAEAILDNFWSLQYMIPSGVVNGFAGPVKTWHANDTGYSMTHAVHLRFASLEVIVRCGKTFVAAYLPSAV